MITRNHGVETLPIHEGIGFFTLEEIVKERTLKPIPRIQKHGVINRRSHVGDEPGVSGHAAETRAICNLVFIKKTSS